MISFQKVYCHIWLILVFHEWMHVLTASFFKIEAESIIIYPFGMCAKFRYFGWGKPWIEACVTLMGIVSHFIVAIILMMLERKQLISSVYFAYLWDINKGLILFNLIPIFPLDGFRLLQCLFHSVFCYQRAYKISLVVSLLCTFIFYFVWFSSISSFMIMILSMISILKMWWNRRFTFYSFYCYRYLHPYKGKHKFHPNQDIYRGYENYLFVNQEIVHELKWLKEKLGKR